MHTFVAVSSGPYAVGEHAVALMCSLKLSSKGLTSRNAVGQRLVTPHLSNLVHSSSVSSQNLWFPFIFQAVEMSCIDVFGGIDELEPKKSDISKLTSPVFQLKFQTWLKHSGIEISQGHTEMLAWETSDYKAPWLVSWLWNQQNQLRESCFLVMLWWSPNSTAPLGKTLHGKRVGIIGTGTPWMSCEDEEEQ